MVGATEWVRAGGLHRQLVSDRRRLPGASLPCADTRASLESTGLEALHRQPIDDDDDDTPHTRQPSGRRCKGVLPPPFAFLYSFRLFALSAARLSELVAVQVRSRARTPGDTDSRGEGTSQTH